MKKSVTKVIILIMVIPMLLIFTMGTAIDVSTVMLDHIPVTSIDIEGDETLFVDVFSDNNTVKLNATVSPVEATNKTVAFTTQAIDGEKEANVVLSQDGLVTPKSTGAIRVIATADGGRQDSVIINFYSTLPTEVSLINENHTIEVGESITIANGVDYLMDQVDAPITYIASNNNIKVNKYTGEVIGLFVGQANVTAKIEGIKYDNALKKFVEHTYELNYNINVVSGDEDSIFSFAGGVNQVQEVMALNSKVIPFDYSGYEDLGQLTYEINADDSDYIESVSFDYGADNKGNILITFKDTAIDKNYIFAIKAGGVELGKITIKKQVPTITIITNKTIFAKSNSNIMFSSEVVGLDDGYEIRYESTNQTIFSVNTRDNDCIARARKEGYATIRARLYVDGNEVAVSQDVIISVVEPYISLGINESSKVYGLENRFVLGKYEYIGDTRVLSSYKLTLKATNASGNVTNIDHSKVVWSSSNTDIATVNENGVVRVVSSGTVTITVESAYNEILGTNIRSSFEIICKDNAINVLDYQGLLLANNNSYETVLLNNIMLADAISNTNYRDYLNNIVTKEMYTTADKTYYSNLGYAEDAKVRYCIEFTNNVYGNGYYIDANNITRSIDKYLYSVFDGPLDLVALKYENNSSGNAKIKAQDNIVFLVKKDNITISNVELKGCSDKVLIDNGQTNLGKLDNVGTVLEIIGDNVNLLYSRVNNGRTLIRVYGSAHESDISKIHNNPDDYRIQTLISNCILSYSREFILKVGSNQILRNASINGDSLALPSENPNKYDHAAPHLIKENGDNYSLTDAKDEYFVDKYLMTDITLKDSIFYGAGLFCIGFESQFAGLVLHGYDYGSYSFSQLGWKDVAGTSYPARIKMQGDVRFYDWKEVSKVDSSSIIEGDSNLLETVGLDLNVANLLNKYNQNNPGNNVVYKYQGNDYVNGAIVFYGGGKNYSWIETDEVSSDFNELSSFDIPLSYFGSRVNLIYYAAGKENFRFMTYKNTNKINYEVQKNELADGSAYSWVIRK